MRVWLVLPVLVMVVLLSPVLVQAKAELSGTTINIWSEGGSHVETCNTLMSSINTTYPNAVLPCISPFAGYCISVNSTINITRGGATNWTNFSVNGCELRMNRSASDSASNIVITSWGNFSVTSSNITTNDSARHSAIIIQPNSNFSMVNSFVSEMGWANAASRRGLELNSPAFAFSNNTLTNGYNGITLYGDANSSVLNNISASSNANRGISLSSSSNNTFTGITANSNYNGIYTYESSNNTFTGITANSN